MKYIHILPILISLFVVSCGTGKNNDFDESNSTENVELSKINFSKSYKITDKEFGTITSVTIKNNKRLMTSNALPNHSTGTFPNSGNPNRISEQNVQYSFPLNPTFSGKSKWAREPGVALNGVKFEPETAERFVCETGEVYRIEAFQDLVNLGLDHNHAHVQPTGAYHYHGVPLELVQKLDKGNDMILIGYAKDGFPMYYSKSGKYKPSYVISKELRTGEVCEYKNPKNSMKESFNNTQPDGTFVSDWIYLEGEGQLDECNGIEINGEYGYFVTDEYPYISRCLQGEFEERRPSGPPPGEHSHRPNQRPHNH